MAETTEELIERTAAAVAEGYCGLDLRDAAGLLLDIDSGSGPEQLVPVALELRDGEVTPDVDRDGDQRMLGMPDLRRDRSMSELCEALNERIGLDERGFVLVEVYWLALAARLDSLLGIPVLVPEVEMPVAEQLRRQRGLPMPGDALAGLEVAVSLPVDDQRIAAVWRIDGSSTRGSARAPEESWPLDWNTELGIDPEVRAGWLPPGAIAAALRDRDGAWHKARTGRGVWLCALPQRAGQHDPPVVYRNIEGHQFEREIVVDALPGLWPRQAGTRPQCMEQTAEHLQYSAGGWDVFVDALDDSENTDFSPLAGTVLGRPHGLGLAWRRSG